MRTLTASVCVVALFAVASGTSAARPGSQRRLEAVTPREYSLIVAINAVRTVHLLPKLGIDTRLVLAARSHSHDMLRRHYFAHGNFGSRMARFQVRGTLEDPKVSASSFNTVTTTVDEVFKGK